ncbi:MAG: beta-lactamase family protein [Pyrinomonadaceae bacterium]|nr:beta-lactamase family protein [Pyrinomonadaceae bacterium]
MKFESVSDLLLERIAAGDFPSAVYLVAEKGTVVAVDAVGRAVIEPEVIDAGPNTIYDLASLTKPLVTGLLSAILIDQGEISLDDRVADLLLDFAAPDKNEITVGEMLTHTSRLAAWLPLYLCVDEPDAIVAEIARTPLLRSNDSVTYSDLNYVALGRLIERVTGRDLDDAAIEMIFEPLALDRTFFRPPSIYRRFTAASETGNRFERQTCESEFPHLPIKPGAFRSEVIWGEVHDGNAHFMGGVAGHAGLFSTADNVFRLAHQFLPEYSTLVSADICELFQRNFSPCGNEHRSVGFQLATTPESTAGTNMSPASFGHLGFTGTSLWIDPVKERVFILLTNRTHCHELPFVLLNSVRRRFHDLAAASLEANS